METLGTNGQVALIKAVCEFDVPKIIFLATLEQQMGRSLAVGLVVISMEGLGNV